MTAKTRNQLLQVLIYEHYVRPHIDFFAIVTAERELIDNFDAVPVGGSPSQETTALVRRCFDRAWQLVERDWADLRHGELAIYGPCGEGQPAQLELPGPETELQ